MPNIQFGFILPVGARDKRERPALLDAMNEALALVTGHFDAAWAVDHLQFGDADVLEGFTILTYLAALHPQLRFGNAVLCQSYRNPALLAKMAATLQFVTGGRFILGLGAGWHEKEYDAYGYQFPSGGVRVEQLREAIQIIRKLWSSDTATFEGRYYTIADARCEPRPVPVPPIMVGAFKPRMLRLTAQYADWWNVSSTSLAAYRPMVEQLEQSCLEVGRDPSVIRRTWAGGCACARTEEDANALVADGRGADGEDDFDFVGTPQQLIDQMVPFIELGVDYFMLDCGGFPRLTTLEMLVDKVMPVLNG